MLVREYEHAVGGVDLGHFHDVDPEYVADDVLQVVLVLRVGEDAEDLARGRRWLHDHDLEAVLDLVVRVVELLDELDQRDLGDVADEDDVLEGLALAGRSVLRVILVLKPLRGNY